MAYKKKYYEKKNIQDIEDDITALFEGVSENEKKMLESLIHTLAVMVWKLNKLTEGIKEDDQASLTNFNSLFKNYVTAVKTLMPYLPKEKKKSLADMLDEKIESEDDG